jgi:hypothetical protein
MEEWLLYCVCTRWNSVQSSTSGHRNTPKNVIFVRVFGPHTRAPYHEGIGIFVDDWKINPISLLGGHGNRKLVQYGLLGSHKMDGVN